MAFSVENKEQSANGLHEVYKCIDNICGTASRLAIEASSTFEGKVYDQNYYDAPSISGLFIYKQKLFELKQEASSVMCDTFFDLFSVTTDCWLFISER